MSQNFIVIETVLITEIKLYSTTASSFAFRFILLLQDHSKIAPQQTH